MPQCSVIVPTYNNAAVLPLTVAALWQQTLPAGWSGQLVVSDDGSADATRYVLAGLRPPANWQLWYIPGNHTGSAGARNRGIGIATGEIALLLGADIVLRPGALTAHLQFHQQHAAQTSAALGLISWDPRLPPSALMEWMVHGGPQNNYDALLGETLADPARFWYGAHVSVKTSVVRRYPFSDAFTQYGWEDIELGRRLKAAGVKLHVLESARALHRHYYSVADICRRQRAVGAGLITYQKLYPSEALLPTRSRMKRWGDWLLGLSGGAALLALVTTLFKNWPLPRLYHRTATVYFWQGVREGESRNK